MPFQQRQRNDVLVMPSGHSMSYDSTTVILKSNQGAPGAKKMKSKGVCLRDLVSRYPQKTFLEGLWRGRQDRNKQKHQGRAIAGQSYIKNQNQAPQPIIAPTKGPKTFKNAIVIQRNTISPQENQRKPKKQATPLKNRLKTALKTFFSVFQVSLR